MHKDENGEPPILPEDEEIQQVKGEGFLEKEELERYLENQRRRDDYRRSSKLLDTFHNNVTLVIGLAVFFGFLIVLVYFIHIALPESMRWLNSSNLTKLENIFTSAFSFISGVGVTIFLTRYFTQE